MLAATGTAAASFFLGAGHLLSTTTFDNLFWAAVVYVVVRVLRGGDPRLWLVAGAVAGVGLLNKHSVAFLLAGLFVGLVLARPDALRSPWPWAGAAVALVLWAPNLVWHAQHDWPVVEMSRSLREEGVSDSNSLTFVPLQLVMFNPAATPLWIAGLVCLLRERAARACRPVAVAYLVLAVVFLLTSGKPYYLAGLYPALLAAGAVWVERRWSASGARRYRAALLAVGDGPVAELNPEHRESYGWPELVRAVERVAEPGDVVLTANYGEAGALDVLGDRDLAVYSGHNHYWWWGPPPDDARGGVVLVGGIPDARFSGCALRARVRNPEDVPNDEYGGAIRRCDRVRRPWSEMWGSLRRYRA